MAMGKAVTDAQRRDRSGKSPVLPVAVAKRTPLCHISHLLMAD